MDRRDAALAQVLERARMSGDWSQTWSVLPVVSRQLFGPQAKKAVGVQATVKQGLCGTGERTKSLPLHSHRSNQNQKVDII